MFQPYKQRNRWKLQSALPSFSHSYSQPFVKPLHRAVPLEANSLSGSLKQDFSVSLQPAFRQTFGSTFSLKIMGKHTMSHGWIMPASNQALVNLCAYVTVKHLCVGVLSMWRQHIYIHDWVMCCVLSSRLYKNISSQPGNSCDVTFCSVGESLCVCKVRGWMRKNILQALVSKV